MTAYRRRSPCVQAVQWTGGNLAAMPLGSFRHPEYDDVLVMPCQAGNLATLTVMLPLSFWAVTDGEGHNTALSEHEFTKHYERTGATDAS